MASESHPLNGWSMDSSIGGTMASLAIAQPTSVVLDTEPGWSELELDTTQIGPINLRELLNATKGLGLGPLSLANITHLYEMTYRQQDNVRNLLVIVAYSVIFFISLFGNLMVCHIIITNRKLHTFTNCFIANLSVSDLLMTVVNVPFGVARLLLHDWPFGEFLCKCLPFIQATSVYVSTITMCIISIDRYCVVVHPLGPRITNVVPLGVVLAVIWAISCGLSIPFSLYHEVSANFIVRKGVRCRANYPSPDWVKALTLLGFLTQYLVPLTIASIAYSSIAFHIKQRSKLGAMTREQIGRILKTNRQTITMLVLVLIVFAICWLPLHLFCMYRDLLDSNLSNTEVFLTAHWLAMSSICYNPFIYSARNKHFRNGMKNFFRHLIFKRREGQLNVDGGGGGSVEHSGLTTQLTSVPSTRQQRGSSTYYLCTFTTNRNSQKCSPRSLCRPRPDDGVQSSSSSADDQCHDQCPDPQPLTHTNGNQMAIADRCGVSVSHSGTVTTNHTTTATTTTLLPKLSWPLIGARRDSNPQIAVTTTNATVPTSGLSRVDSCQATSKHFNSSHNVSLLSWHSDSDTAATTTTAIITTTATTTTTTTNTTTTGMTDVYCNNGGAKSVSQSGKRVQPVSVIICNSIGGRLPVVELAAHRPPDQTDHRTDSQTNHRRWTGEESHV